MTNRISKLFFNGTLAAALVSASSAVSAQAADDASKKAADKVAEFLGDAVVAKGKGVEIKRSQIDEVIINYKAAMAASGRPPAPQESRNIERRVLDDLIGKQLLLSRATAEDKAKGKEQLDTAIAKIKTEGKLTDAEFDEKLGLQLKAQSLTRDQWNQRQLEQAIVLTVLERELKINVSEADLKKFYDEHPSQFEKPERVRVSHILISTKDSADNTPDPSMKRDLSEAQVQAKRKQIDDLQKRARAGEDFTKLAKEFSEDPGVKQNDGEYTLSRADSFVPEFKTAAFALQTNQVSEVIKTVYGFHILKLMEKMPAQKVELTEVSERLKQALKQQEIAKLAPDYMEKIQKDANVEILDEKLKATDLEPKLPKLAPPDGKK